MKTYSISNPKQNHEPEYELNMSPLNVFICLLYLAVVSLGANFSGHVLLVQRWRDAKTVAHAKTLHSPLRVADLHCSVQDNIPVVELQTSNKTTRLTFLPPKLMQACESFYCLPFIVDFSADASKSCTSISFYFAQGHFDM